MEEPYPNKWPVFASYFLATVTSMKFFEYPNLEVLLASENIKEPSQRLWGSEFFIFKNLRTGGCLIPKILNTQNLLLLKIIKEQSNSVNHLLITFTFSTLRATLDEGTRSRDQWIQAILLVESFKLVPRPLNKGPKPKSGKLRLNVPGTCFGGKINWFRPKNSGKRRAPDLENPK